MFPTEQITEDNKIIYIGTFKIIIKYYAVGWLKV